VLTYTLIIYGVGCFQYWT